MLDRTGTRRVLTLALLIAVVLFSMRSLSLAVEDREEIVRFGPIGVGRGEGLRVSVYGVGNPDIMPRDVLVRVFNRQGAMVQEERLQLAAHAIASMDVAVGDVENFPVERLGRRTLRVEIVGFNPQPDPPGSYAASLEVYRLSTGHTSILLGGPDTLPPPLR